MRGDGAIYNRGTAEKPNYWIRFSVDGKEHKEPAKTTDPKVAQRMLRRRLKAVAVHELEGEKFITAKDRKRTLDDLLDALQRHYKLDGKLSDSGEHGGQLRALIRKAKADFGDHHGRRARALELTSEDIDCYIEAELARGYKPASINRVTQTLGQAFRIAELPCPKIRHLSEDGNERRGFFEDADFLAMLDNLRAFDPDLSDFVEWGWITGQRRKEIRSLQWAYLEGDVLRLAAKDAKGRKKRDIPIVGERLTALMERRRAARAVPQADGTVVMADLIFHRSGRAVKDFRDAWHTACRKAGVEGKLFHDLRRTAARNMLQAGVSRTVCKDITGHRTDSMFDRYTMPAERDLREGLELVQSRPMKTSRTICTVTEQTGAEPTPEKAQATEKTATQEGQTASHTRFDGGRGFSRTRFA